MRPVEALGDAQVVKVLALKVTGVTGMTGSQVA